jgi:hypothetical protein
MENRKQIIITTQLEYEEVMSYLHSFKFIPKIGGTVYLQWLELKQAAENYEKEQQIAKF